MIKFTLLELDGYGFDLLADRVVRFNKHPDGTYLNTRATYAINKKRYTHFDLRMQAIKEHPEPEIPAKVIQLPIRNPFSKWLILTLLFLVLVVPLSECSIETTSNVTVENTK